MAELAELLIDISESTDLDVLADALTLTPVSAAAPMPTAEHEIWLSGASPAAREALADHRPLNAQRAEVAALQVQTLQRLGAITTDAAGIAKRLGKTESTVSRMTANDRLRPFRLGGRRLYPWWQVWGPHLGKWAVVPHVGAICDAAEAIHLHPLSLDGFLHEHQDVLQAQTPLEWLIGGGDPTPVVELIDALRR